MYTRPIKKHITLHYDLCKIFPLHQKSSRVRCNRPYPFESNSLAFLRNYMALHARHVYRNLYSSAIRLTPVGTILYCLDDRNTKVIIDPRRGQQPAAHACARRTGRTDVGDTKVGQYWQMRRYICRALSRGVGDGRERTNRPGMHRNCAHCLMRARRIRIDDRLHQLSALNPFLARGRGRGTNGRTRGRRDECR